MAHMRECRIALSLQFVSNDVLVKYKVEPNKVTGLQPIQNISATIIFSKIHLDIRKRQNRDNQ